MMKGSGLFFLAITIFLVTCDSGKSQNEKELNNELWSYEEAIQDNGEKIEVAPYNESIQKAMSVRLPWAYSPLSIALRVAGQQMIAPNVNMVAKSLSGNELITDAAVIIEKLNLPDDSLDDEYYWIRLKLGGTVWQVAEIKHAWKCKDGRGHQNLSAEKCK